MSRLGPAALAVLIVTLLALAAAPPARAQGPSGLPMPGGGTLPRLEEMVTQYRELALRGEYGGAWRRGRIIKWTGPIVAQLRGADVALYELEVVEHLTLLARLTGLRFKLVRTGVAAPTPNMVITFVHNRGRGPTNLEQVCSARVFSGPDYAIRRAEIVIHSDWRRVRRHCILEELSQALGLMNDSAYLSPSIFNDESKQQRLSPWDELVIRAHYDRRLLPGMNWATAEPIVRDHLARRLAVPAASPRARQKRRRRR